MPKAQKKPPLEKGLNMLMKAIDNQVARDMQRDPGEREERGVRRWDPHDKRIERVAAHVITGLGDGEYQIDSLVVLSQAFAKALQIFVEEMGEEGLGKVRTEYCSVALESIREAARRGLGEIETEDTVFN